MNTDSVTIRDKMSLLIQALWSGIPYQVTLSNTKSFNLQLYHTVTYGLSYCPISEGTLQLGTVMEKSSAPFSLGGDNLKWYFDQR